MYIIVNCVKINFSYLFNYSLLRGAEELALSKPLKQKYGGGLKEFTCEEESMFEGVRDKESFLTSQVGVSRNRIKSVEISTPWESMWSVYSIGSELSTEDSKLGKSQNFEVLYKYLSKLYDVI